MVQGVVPITPSTRASYLSAEHVSDDAEVVDEGSGSGPGRRAHHTVDKG